MNPTILKSDILAFAPEFAATDQLEIQSITPSGIPVSGSYVLSLGANPTAAINWDDSEATIQAKLNAITGVPPNGFSVLGDLLTTSQTDVTFQGTLVNAAQPLLTVSANTMVDAGAAPVTLAIQFAQQGPPSQLDTQLAILNLMADNVVASPPYPSQATNNSVYTPIYMVKMLVICHWLKMTKNTEGRVMSDKVGDLASQYAVPNTTEANDWNNSIYGQRYIQFRRIYAPGISSSPIPTNPFYGTPLVP